MSRFRRLVAVLVSCTLMLGGAAQAQSGLSFIRDAEIERTLKQLSAPIFQSAGLASDGVDLFIVADNSLNAFVAGGRNMVFHTGLLKKLEGPNELAGVIAHETGHIAGGHLARRQEAVRNARGPMLLSYLLGVAAAAAGSGQAGAAVIAGGSQIAQRGFLRYNRSEESAADQAAVSYLERAGIDPAGLLGVLDTLEEQEMFLAGRQDPYALTHPMSRERITALKRRIQPGQYSENPELRYWHDRMRAKLAGFLDAPERVFNTYHETDTSEAALYARAVAYHRLPQRASAVRTIDTLIARRPSDPFYHELKGQILFESGDPRAAVGPYQQAVNLAPDEPLIRVGLAQALAALDTPETDRRAREALEYVVSRDRFELRAWRLLSIVSARLGDRGAAASAAAETHALRGDIKAAKREAERARRAAPVGSPEWLRAGDILALPDKDS